MTEIVETPSVAPVPSYKIVQARSPGDLSREVNQLLSEGWRVAGGLATSPPGVVSSTGYFQAMTKTP